MASLRAALTDDDLRTLVKGATADERAFAAHKLCRAIDSDTLSEEERARAHDILRLMARDAAELVRRALAVTLKSSPVMPRDVALSLARDLDSIAVPVLNFSPAFTDEDLIDLVRKGGPVRQTAIAKRHSLSESVAGALAEAGCEEAVRLACANDNAALDSGALGVAIDRFTRSEPVLTAIAYRKILPPAISERLITLVSESIRAHLVQHHGVSPALAEQIAAGARERATLDLIDQGARAADVAAFVRHLNRGGRLTASLLLRALAQGHMALFEAGVAELAGVPQQRTWLMIHDAGPLGLKAIYDRAGLPARMFPAFRCGVDTFHSLNLDGGTDDLNRFHERMLERFLTQPQVVPREDLDYLLDKMDRLTADSALIARQSHARVGAAG